MTAFNNDSAGNSLNHLWALILKETREILRNPYLLFLIIVPPTIQLLILGGALDPQVRNLSLGVVDHSQSVQSRDLVKSLTGSGVFPKSVALKDEGVVSHQLEYGTLDVALVIPEDFSKKLASGNAAPVQVLVDGADAYSAGIASAYVLKTIYGFRPEEFNQAFKAKILEEVKERARFSAHQKEDLSSSAESTGDAASGSGMGKLFTGSQMNASALVAPDIQILYNPQLVASWFFVPGVLGASLTLTATLVASAAVLRERESGTMEQLLMTPAETWEILLAKILPLLTFLLADVCMAIGAAVVFFHLPVRGNLFLFLFASMLYIFVGIGFGMLLGTLCKNQRQSQLTSFFINIPLILLSGSVVPLDTMPAFLQVISIFNPLRYYVFLAREVILKGDGLDIVWPQLGILIIAALLLIAVSANRFNRQTL
ncbi:MAG: ABC transporter permease [Cyanobacteria bacterium SZAS TMP-1]|nr:ABC transporter permease [Cyanobacteria bacterium SZAS TMP-1]